MLNNSAKVYEMIAAAAARQYGYGAGLLSPEAIENAAQFLSQGGTMSQLGVSYRDIVDRTAILNRVPEIYAEQHRGDAMYQGPEGERALMADAAQARLDAQIGLAGERAEVTTAARVSGRVQGAVNDMRRLIPEAERLVRQMADSRTPWVPFNAMLANLDRYSSDPRYAGFVQVNQNIMRLYRSLGVGTVGRSTGEERAQATQELNTATGPRAYLSALNAIDYEGWSAQLGFHEATRPQSYRDISQAPEPTRPSQYDPSQPVGQPRDDSNLPIMTPEQVRAAPKGTRYRTTDGRTGTAPGPQ
jgi:hypothetical protein